MSVTIDQAGLCDEFHIAHAGLPCTIWTRDGTTHYGVGEGQFRVPVISYDEDTGRRMFCGITTVNAGDFHTATDCPRRARSDRSEDPPVTDYPVLSGERDPDGYDAFGFDARGFDAGGYDRNGYDDLGYDRAGYDRAGYDPAGFDRYGYNRDGYDDNGYDVSGYDAAGINADGYNRDGDRYCDNCESAPCGCARCYQCERGFPDGGSLTYTLDDVSVCDGCRASYWSWCGDCDGWYRDEYADDHAHDEDEDEDSDCCCESPQPEFRVRNDGCEPLASDTRVTVTLPAGVISDEGLTAIRSYLMQAGQYDLSYDLDGLGNQWQAKTGNFTRRLSRHAYQAHQAKLTPEMLSQVGCIARDHSSQVSTGIEVTRDLNRPAYEFANDGSCWWNSYGSSRCALKTNGGFGLRSFDEYGNVAGRAWVMPLKLDTAGMIPQYSRPVPPRLTPTFETMTPDAFVVFNGYGDLSGYTAPRIVAHMAGWTYRKISFTCDPMYVNAGGYLVAPEDIAEQYTDGSLSLSVSQHSRLFENERELVNA